MANDDLYIFDPDKEDWVPNPEVTKDDDFGVTEYVDGELVVLSYEQLSGYLNQQPGGSGPESLYPPGTFYVAAQNRHIALDGTIRVDVVLDIVDDIPGKQYELRVTRQ